MIQNVNVSDYLSRQWSYWQRWDRQIVVASCWLEEEHTEQEEHQILHRSQRIRALHVLQFDFNFVSNRTHPHKVHLVSTKSISFPQSTSRFLLFVCFQLDCCRLIARFGLRRIDRIHYFQGSPLVHRTANLCVFDLSIALLPRHRLVLILDLNWCIQSHRHRRRRSDRVLRSCGLDRTHRRYGHHVVCLSVNLQIGCWICLVDFNRWGFSKWMMNADALDLELYTKFGFDYGSFLINLRCHINRDRVRMQIWAKCWVIIESEQLLQFMKSEGTKIWHSRWLQLRVHAVCHSLSTWTSWEKRTVSSMTQRRPLNGQCVDEMCDDLLVFMKTDNESNARKLSHFHFL